MGGDGLIDVYALHAILLTTLLQHHNLTPYAPRGNRQRFALANGGLQVLIEVLDVVAKILIGLVRLFDPGQVFAVVATVGAGLGVQY